MVTVDIDRSSLNYKDGMALTGKGRIVRSYPMVPGIDFAGTVEAVGSKVERFRPGDEVFGCAGGLADLPGALADYIVADAQLVIYIETISESSEAVISMSPPTLMFESPTRSGPATRSSGRRSHRSTNWGLPA